MAIDPLASGAYVIPPTVLPAPPPVVQEPGAPRLDASRDRSDDRGDEGTGTGSGSSGRPPVVTSAADSRGSLVDIQA